MKLKNFLTKNLSVKIICLSAAGVLWLYVALSSSAVAKFPGTIKVSASNTPPNLVAIYDEKEVEIKISAKQSVWQKLTPESFSAFIDLSGLTEGTHQVPINVIPRVNGVSVTQITPGRIVVSLEKVVSKEVPINKKIEGSAADGMVASAVKFDPLKVEISGAKSIIDNLTEVIGTVTLNGEQADFERNVALDAYGEDGKQLDNVEITPSHAQVFVSIVKGANTKLVGIKPKIIGTPKGGYFISNIALDPSVVELTGVGSTINDIKSIDTAPIDISNSSSDIERDLALSIPVGMSLVGTTIQKAHILISISRIEVSKEVSVSSFRTLNQGDIVVLNYSSSNIKVVCQGVASAISDLKDTDITLTLDFKNKTPNLAKEITFALASDQFDTPPGVSIVSIDPSVLTLRTK